MNDQLNSITSQNTQGSFLNLNGMGSSQMDAGASVIAGWSGVVSGSEYLYGLPNDGIQISDAQLSETQKTEVQKMIMAVFCDTNFWRELTYREKDMVRDLAKEEINAHMYAKPAPTPANTVTGPGSEPGSAWQITSARLEELKRSILSFSLFS